MPEPREHTKRRNAIETVLRYIPGFRGYLEKEYRRESDELQREWLADRLQRSKRALDTFALALTDAGQFDALSQVERLRSRLDRLLARIKGAMQGYSGIFDLVRIDEQELDQVYEFDVQLMQHVEAIADQIESLRPAADGSASSALSAAIEKVESIEQSWDQREDILKGLK